jgi:hypothetical protein
MTRRAFAAGLAAGPYLRAYDNSDGWTAEWDRALLQCAVTLQDQAYDPAESMLVRQIGTEYHYHTNVRNRRAHPTRDSLDYSLNLLETGEAGRQKRAFDVLERLLALQDTDPGSKWYGLWGYYMEEPASKMSPADWNWADFNGSTLLMLNARHDGQLSPALQGNVWSAAELQAKSGEGQGSAVMYSVFVESISGPRRNPLRSFPHKVGGLGRPLP